MSNEMFKQYATGTAFSISLTKNQCHYLLSLDGLELRKSTQRYRDGSEEEYLEIKIPIICDVHIMDGLGRRGLVSWRLDRNGQVHGFLGLTEAGKLMVALLKEAGITKENTTTLSIVAAQQRRGAA